MRSSHDPVPSGVQLFPSAVRPSVVDRFRLEPRGDHEAQEVVINAGMATA